MPLDDLTGQEFGRQKALSHVGVPVGAKTGVTHYKIVCLDCGKTRLAQRGLLLKIRKKGSVGCRCGRTKADRESFLGRRIDHVTITGTARTKNKQVIWLGRCDCGSRMGYSTADVKRRIGLGAAACRSCLLSKDDDVIVRGLIPHEVRHSARNNGRKITLTDKQILTLAGQSCHYCGEPPEKRSRKLENRTISYYANGVDRRNPKLDYVPGNSVSCCIRCNYMKSALSYDAYLAMCTAITVRHPS